MEKRRRRNTRLQKSFDELEARQQNMTWPNFVSNARSVDEYLIKGSPDAPMVQRIGAWLFGLFFLIGGVGFLFAGAPNFVAVPISAAMTLLGVHTFMIGCRKRNKPRPE